MQSFIPSEHIENKIYVIRGLRVMIDYDLAQLYGAQTKVLNQAVKRNSERFPESFMFALTKEESESLRSQIVTSNIGHGGARYLPQVFTEQGVAMLSAVLKSQQAVTVSIQIMKTFVHLRESARDNSTIHRKIEALEKHYDQQFKTVFDACIKLSPTKRRNPKSVFRKNPPNAKPAPGRNPRAGRDEKCFHLNPRVCVVLRHRTTAETKEHADRDTVRTQLDRGLNLRRHHLHLGRRIDHPKPGQT
jgi:hypothetical protein